MKEGGREGRREAGLPKTSLHSLYYSLVYPYLICGVSVWGSTYHSNLKRIIILPEKSIRIISKGPHTRLLLVCLFVCLVFFRFSPFFKSIKKYHIMYLHIQYPKLTLFALYSQEPLVHKPPSFYVGFLAGAFFPQNI